MDTTFYIVLNIKSGTHYEAYSKFMLCNDRNFAFAVFDQLKGNKEVNGESVIYLDFMETKHGLPVKLDVLSCTLNELADNCKLITKEIFKQLNLENIL